MSGADDALIEAARQVRERAHAPLSSYRVGAALLSASGAIVTGCNVENIVLPESVCAEKAAIVKGVSEGHSVFEAVAVFTDDDPPGSPCGSCRQMLHTWGVKRVILANPRGERQVIELAELLPRAFSLLPSP